ncbi:MAG: hypothetical protein KKA28_05435 [Planctomycetes bacterium]|nr:hypothetical protein [Planctomycetota bacterium]MCG2683642.1 hypothetical protein [Planctomycetales bacterium]
MADKDKKRLLAGTDRLIADRDRLIGEYEWLRRMACHLDMETERIDRQLIELENLLPDDYVFPSDPSES